jgi:gamma-glutamyltranspeptidase/glutathione hydrolase
MFTTRPELVGTYGMAATTHWLASTAAMAILEDGGNAFDAAAAAGFVLQVAEPHLNGPAGQLPVLFATASERTPRMLCGHGVAPANATAEHFTDLGLDLIPGSGPLPAIVPGAWDAWLLLLRDHGTKHLRDVIKYAISYARHGVPVLNQTSAVIDVVAKMFTEHWPTSAELWLPDGRPPAPGTLHRNPVLADTWARLLREAEHVSDQVEQIERARRAWSQGFVADAIDEFSQKAFVDDTGQPHKGLLTGQDMTDWRATYEDPLVVDVGEWSLVKGGIWTQGPAFVQQLLMLAGFADQLSYRGGIPSARTIHLIAECAKLAFADREAWFGDSADVPVADLLASEYIAERSRLVTDHASGELIPGAPAGRTPRLARLVAENRGKINKSGPTGEPIVLPRGTPRGDTVHISVVDRAGNMVAATPSGGWLQSSPTIGGLGFCLDTRLQAFWLEQGLPNSLQPGKRPRTTLSPSMALRGGEPVLAFGTPGGDQQEQWQLCFWLAHTVGGLNLQEAVETPAWHTTAFPNSFFPRFWTPRELIVESRVGEGTIEELKARGHHVVDAGPWAFGGLCAVARDPVTNVMRGAANPRAMKAYAIGR